MILFPPAKINIGLDVVAKRPDGYHEIETIFHPISLYDILEIVPSDNFSFQSSGLDIPGEGNLCISAYKLLKKDFNLPPVNIHLHKIIPIGAGLGGGSSDATFTLKGLNQLFNLKLTNDQFYFYALQLGADCPFFIDLKTRFARGIGNDIQDVDLDLSNYHIVIVKPEINISTSEAYSLIQIESLPGFLKQKIRSPIREWEVKNDFEKYIFQKFPEIKKIKKILYEKGALYASMTGTGSSVFGIFENKQTISISNYKVFYC